MNFIGVSLAVVGLAFCSVHPLAIAIVGIFGFICACGSSEKTCSCKNCAK